jgi:O-antigen/teichoic acid export membrane protein
MKSLREKILSDSLLLLGRTILLRLIQIPVFIFVAKTVGPTNFGLLKLFELIPGLAKYGNIDYSSVLVREIGKLSSKNDSEHSVERNVAFSASIIWSLIIVVIISLGSLFVDSVIVQNGILISAVTLFLTSIGKLYLTNCKLIKNFKIIASAEVIRGIVTAVITIGLVSILGIYGPLFALLIGTIVMIFFLRKKITLKMSFFLEKNELWRQTKIAIPLSLGTFAYGATTWLERIMVTSFWGLEVLGYYMILVTILMYIHMMVTSAVQAISVHIYDKLSNKCGSMDVINMLYIPTLTFAVLVPLLAAFVVFYLPLIINWILPEYTEALPLVEYIAINIWIFCLPSVYSVALNSTYVNKQNLVIWLYLFSAVLFSSITIWSWKINFGIEAVLIARAISLIFLAVSMILITSFALEVKKKVLIKHMLDYFIPGILAIFLVIFIEKNTAGFDLLIQIFLKPVLFIVMYSPVLVYWERRTGTLSKFFELIHTKAP